MITGFLLLCSLFSYACAVQNGEQTRPPAKKQRAAQAARTGKLPLPNKAAPIAALAAAAVEQGSAAAREVLVV